MRSLIINADDLGYDPAVNRGILRAMREGIVSSATLMVNTPFSEEGAREGKGLCLGLHFNLARGRPCDPGFPQATLSEALAPQLPAEVVAKEARAQIARFTALTDQAPTHVDVHKHLHLHPAILEGLILAAREAALPVRSINPTMRATLQKAGVATNDHFIGEAGKEAYWTLPQLETQLDQLPPDGVIELMCHPGYAPTSLQSGYSTQREVELETFLAPQAKQALQRRGLTPQNFRICSR